MMESVEKFFYHYGRASDVSAVWALPLISSARANHSASFCSRHCSMIGSTTGDKNPTVFEDFPLLKNIGERFRYSTI
jgi:hypothetical protein